MRVKGFNTNTKNSQIWLTPPEIIKSLGSFDLDPCSPIARPWNTAKHHHTLIENGLQTKWFGRVWCNPPYGKQTFLWLKKLAKHGNGIALVFARTETRGFHSEIWGKADGVFFFKGRLAFYKTNGTKGNTANAPSCLIAYGYNNLISIQNSGLNGKLVCFK